MARLGQAASHNHLGNHTCAQLAVLVLGRADSGRADSPPISIRPASSKVHLVFFGEDSFIVEDDGHEGGYPLHDHR